MERLTERTADGIAVKEEYGEEVLKTIYQCYGAEPMPHYANCDEGYCAMEKLAEYEDLEEQEKLLKLPCKVGDIVYRPWTIGGRRVIAEFRVDDFRLIDNEWLVLVSGKNGRNVRKWSICDFEKIVFLTKEEAEAALREMNGTGGQ